EVQEGSRSDSRSARKRAHAGSRPSLLPDLLERPEGRSRLPGMRVDRTRRLGTPKTRLAGTGGGRPCRRGEGEDARRQTGGLYGAEKSGGTHLHYRLQDGVAGRHTAYWRKWASRSVGGGVG